MAQSTLKMFFLSSKLILTFYILIWFWPWGTSGLVQGTVAEPPSIPNNEKPFQPHMLFHPIEGCPPNSMCNEEMGKQRQKWLSVVKQVRDKKLNITALEDFRKNQGLPFNVWLKGEMQPKDEITTAPADLGKLKVNEKGPVAYWDSPCEYHRKQERPIHTAQIFLKGLAAKSLATTIRNFHGMIQLQKAYLFDQNVGPNGTPLLSEFVIPRDETPLLILPKKLVFVMEEEGLFYHLNIDHSGDIQITEPTSNNSNQLSESVACPDYALRPLTQLLNQDKTIYQVAQCRQYTHFGHKYILLIPSGCY